MCPDECKWTNTIDKWLKKHRHEMRIIKEGKLETKEYKMVCVNCGCVAMYTKEDIKRDRDGAYVLCPCCGTFLSH